MWSLTPPQLLKLAVSPGGMGCLLDGEGEPDREGSLLPLGWGVGGTVGDQLSALRASWVPRRDENQFSLSLHLPGKRGPLHSPRAACTYYQLPWLKAPKAFHPPVCASAQDSGQWPSRERPRPPPGHPSAAGRSSSSPDAPHSLLSGQSPALNKFINIHVNNLLHLPHAFLLTGHFQIHHLLQSSPPAGGGRTGRR